MTAALAALVLLAWLALQPIVAAVLHHLQHPTTTPEEGNHA